MTESAGIVLARIRISPEVLLVHPGGPFWAEKDQHAWSIPKGEFDPDHEESLDAARREFAEELGRPAPDLDYQLLGILRAGNKRIHAWFGVTAADSTEPGALDFREITSNEFEMEWPPRSGSLQRFPEVDRADWFPLEDATTKLHKGQADLVPLINEILG